MSRQTYFLSVILVALLLGLQFLCPIAVVVALEPLAYNASSVSSSAPTTQGIVYHRQILYLTSANWDILYQVNLTNRDASGWIVGYPSTNPSVDGPVATAVLNHPKGLAKFGEDLFWVEDRGAALRRLRAGIVTTLFRAEHNLYGLLLSADGSVAYMSERTNTHNVLVYDFQSNTTSVVNADPGAFGNPRGLAFSTNSETELVVADHSRIRLLHVVTGAVRILIGNGTRAVIDGPNEDARCSSSRGIVISKVKDVGTIYFTEYLEHVVRRIRNGATTTVAGVNGVPGWLSGLGGIATMNGPLSLAFNDDETVLFVGQRTTRLMKVNITYEAEGSFPFGPQINNRPNTGNHFPGGSSGLPAARPTGLPVAPPFNNSTDEEGSTESPAVSNSTTTTTAPSSTSAPATATVVAPPTSTATTSTPSSPLPTSKPTPAVPSSTATALPPPPPPPRSTDSEIEVPAAPAVTGTTPQPQLPTQPAATRPLSTVAAAPTIPASPPSLPTTTMAADPTVASTTTPPPTTSSPAVPEVTTSRPPSSPPLSTSTITATTPSAPHSTEAMTPLPTRIEAPPRTLEPPPPAGEPQQERPVLQMALTLSLSIDEVKSNMGDLKVKLASSCNVHPEFIRITSVRVGSTVVEFEVQTSQSDDEVRGSMQSSMQPGGALETFQPVVESFTMKRKAGPALFQLGVLFYAVVAVCACVVLGALGWAVFRAKNPYVPLKTVPRLIKGRSGRGFDITLEADEHDGREMTMKEKTTSSSDRIQSDKEGEEEEVHDDDDTEFLLCSVGAASPSLLRPEDIVFQSNGESAKLRAVDYSLASEQSFHIKYLDDPAAANTTAATTDERTMDDEEDRCAFPAPTPTPTATAECGCVIIPIPELPPKVPKLKDQLMLRRASSIVTGRGRSRLVMNAHSPPKAGSSSVCVPIIMEKQADEKKPTSRVPNPFASPSDDSDSTSSRDDSRSPPGSADTSTTTRSSATSTDSTSSTASPKSSTKQTKEVKRNQMPSLERLIMQLQPSREVIDGDLEGSYRVQ